MTSFDSSRWVPTMMSIWPDASCDHEIFLFLLRAEPADQLDADREAGEPVAQGPQVLKGEHGRRREKRDLFAVDHGLEGRTHGDLGLAVPDVAAEQPVHRGRLFHVARDVGDCRQLVGRQVVFERVVEFLLPVGVG